MIVFFKTFFICLVVCLCFFVYKFVLNESYEPNLNISKDNPVFKYNKEEKNEPVKTEEKLQKYDYICYFYSNSGKLIPLKRSFSIKQSIENNIIMLLKGPTILEERKGIYSEIPKNVDLISVKEDDDSIIINLTSEFGNGGGSQSVENRVKQLSQTVKNRVKDKKVYLYIENKEVEYLGGEGVYIKQPLE